MVINIRERKELTGTATNQITFEDQQLRMTQQGIPDVHCCTHQVKSSNGQKKKKDEN